MTSSEYFFLDSYHNLKEYQGHEWLKIESALQNKSEIPYTYFGHLGHRVRILREYMDNQKPRGFRQLWKDSRDSFNYYTFWGVIIFLALSVFSWQWHHLQLVLLRHMLLSRLLDSRCGLVLWEVSLGMS